MAPQAPSASENAEIGTNLLEEIKVDAKPAGAITLPVVVEASEQNPEEQSKIAGEAVLMEADIQATDDAPLDVIQQEKP